MKIERLRPYIGNEDSILDIGTGNGLLSSALQKKGFRVVSLDVANHSFVEDIKPVIYDGKRIPFEDGRFDTALLITVLHHTADPEAVIHEAARVAKKVIVIEEVYSSVPDKYWVFFIDSLFNFEFFGHPHTNKADEQWKQTFAEFGLQIAATDTYREFPALKRVLYVLRSIESQEF